MDKVKYLNILKLIEQPGLIGAIGEIDGKSAIYTISPIKITDKDFEKFRFVEFEKNFTDDENLQEENNFKAASTIQLEVPVRLIYPATENHIKKFTQKLTFKTESYDQYLKDCENLKPTWMDAIANKTAKGEKIFFETNDYLIVSDYKWNESYGVDNLYLLVVFKDSKLKSIRDISDVNMLIECKKNILKVLEKYNLFEENVLLYFHYKPSYYKLHIHVVNISNNTKFLGCRIRNILLDDVIKNINLDPNYYKGDMYVLSE